MQWSEDFEDVPAVEERLPGGLSSVEMREVFFAASMGTCECCGTQSPIESFIVTGTYEYYTMDVDPYSMFCAECYEAERMRHIPSDPMFFDGLTPIHSYASL